MAEQLNLPIKCDHDFCEWWTERTIFVEPLYFVGHLKITKYGDSSVTRIQKRECRICTEEQWLVPKGFDEKRL